MGLRRDDRRRLPLRRGMGLRRGQHLPAAPAHAQLRAPPHRGRRDDPQPRRGRHERRPLRRGDYTTVQGTVDTAVGSQSPGFCIASEQILTSHPLPPSEAPYAAPFLFAASALPDSRRAAGRAPVRRRGERGRAPADRRARGVLGGHERHADPELLRDGDDCAGRRAPAQGEHQPVHAGASPVRGRSRHAGQRRRAAGRWSGRGRRSGRGRVRDDTLRRRDCGPDVRRRRSARRRYSARRRPSARRRCCARRRFCARRGDVPSAAGRGDAPAAHGRGDVPTAPRRGDGPGARPPSRPPLHHGRRGGQPLRRLATARTGAPGPRPQQRHGAPGRGLPDRGRERRRLRRGGPGLRRRDHD